MEVGEGIFYSQLVGDERLGDCELCQCRIEKSEYLVK
jgi:hypothetical protein